MPRQRILTIPQSLRVAKVWYQLLEVREGRVFWEFWSRDEAEFVQLCAEANIHDLMDFPAPYVRSLASLKVFLKCITTYLSRGYFEGDLDTWIANPVVPVAPADGAAPQPPGGGLQAERDALILGTPDCEGSTVTAMTTRAREVLEVIDYQREKMRLGENVVECYNKYLPLNNDVDGLRNKVIRTEITKASALTKINKVLEELDLLFVTLKTFYDKEPGEAAYEGCLFAIGEVFLDQVDQPALDALIIEATNRDRTLIMRASGNVHAIRDIPPLSDRYEALLDEYQEINGLRTDREDQGKDVERRLKQFLSELNSLKEEINSAEEEELVVLVLKDYLDQISELKKKIGAIRALTNEELVTPDITQEEEDRDRVTFVATYTVYEWLTKTRRRLLLLKEEQEKENRKKENQEKILLQETLKIASKTTIRDLDSRRVFLPWHEDYQKTKSSFKRTNLPDWKDSVLRVAKKSLKRQVDIEACMFLNSLSEFEAYISTEYIVGVNMLNDLFSKLFSMSKAENIPESIARITEAMNVVRTVKARSLWVKFNETHLDKTIKICLLRRDANEFENEWAKKRSKAMFASEAASLVEDDDEESGIDMDKTINEEITKGTLDEKKTFLVEFMRTKLLELGSKQAAVRNMEGENQTEKKEKRTIRFKRGDKVFRVTETNADDESSSEDDTDLAESLEAVLALKDESPSMSARKRTKLPQKKCPLKCDRKFHSNGSAYFCSTFRAKDLEEKKELVKKLPLCILCLVKGTKTHDCPVGKCAKCAGHHNVLLCSKREDENILKISEQHDESSSDSEDEDQEDYTNNKETVAIVKGRDTKDGKAGDAQKGTKRGLKGKESEKDVDKRTHEDKMTKLKGVLKEVARGHETGKKVSFNEGQANAQPEKTFFIRDMSIHEEDSNDEGSLENGSEMESEKEPSSSESDLDSFDKDSEEDLSNSEVAESAEDSEDDTVSDNSKVNESDIFYSNEETETEDEANTDGSRSEKCLLVSSAANIRRRELQGQGGYFKTENKENEEKKTCQKEKGGQGRNGKSGEYEKKDQRRSRKGHQRIKEKESQEGSSQHRKMGDIRSVEGDCSRGRRGK